jgi:tripartite-type tricarboxylate transporter receptor subunit TctC
MLKVLLFATMAFASLWSGPSRSQEQFYAGKTINIIVGFGPGGGYDLYARLLSRHLARHIPGNPSIVVQNLIGAGSVRATDYVYFSAPKDGTYIAAVNQNMPMYSIFGGASARFDARKFVWLGSMGASNGLIYTWTTSKVKTIEDAMKTEAVLGGAGTNSDSHIFPTMLNNLLHTKFKVINGYSGGSKEIDLAIERGEVEGRGGNSWASVSSNNARWIAEKKLNILVQIGLQPEKDLQGIPMLQDLVKTERERQIVDLISLATAIGYAHWVAPGTPEPQVEIVRKAYADTMKDPAFLAEATKMGVMLRPMTGAELESFVKKVSSAPQSSIDEAAKVLEWQN